MTSLVQGAIGVVDSCESKFALVGETGYFQGRQDQARKENNLPELLPNQGKRNVIAVDDTIKRIQPHREIASGDSSLLQQLLIQLQGPIRDFQDQVDRAADLVITGLAYCYDVPKLPSGFITPKCILLAEYDIIVDVFANAISDFERYTLRALAKAASIQHSDGHQVRFFHSLQRASLDRHDLFSSHPSMIAEPNQNSIPYLSSSTSLDIQSQLHFYRP
jgi:hypothetical protein